MSISCQKSKMHRHTKSPIQSFVLPNSSRFQYVHLDLVGPLPIASEPSLPHSTPYRYLLTMICRSTRWIEAAPLVDITAHSVARAFLDTWISRWGVPLFVCTDQGRQFESELFAHLSSTIGFTRLRTSAYHPSCNGILERTHRRLKSIIVARKSDWLSYLPLLCSECVVIRILTPITRLLFFHWFAHDHSIRHIHRIKSFERRFSHSRYVAPFSAT